LGKIRICLVGAGRAGEVHGDVYKLSVPDSEIVAIFDTDKVKAENMATKYKLPKSMAFINLEDAIRNADFDAVVITTPTFTHLQYTEIAANNNMHVFCEKPMCITLEDCDRMIDICKKANVILQIGFMRRFDAGFIKAKRMIMDGTIGEPIIVKSVGRGPGLPGKWAYDIKNSNGMLAEVNSHDFDSIRWFANSEYKSIYSVAKNSKNPEIGKEYPRFYDNATVLATLNNQVFGIIDSVCPCDYGYDARVEVVGTKGVIFIGSLQEYTTVTCTREKGFVAPQVLSWKKRFHDAYIAEDRHFIDCILSGKSPSVSGEDGKFAVQAVIAANESILKNIPINL
jgi:predicted dehydrogenase